ncbi:Uncharacterized protein HZ326_14966 [Fusarium oxysporum f. sp. albedinis]|nr:Uncharacterized protein HZ326_14966 [Fusarium oxysporum f. sp. albedinis]
MTADRYDYMQHMRSIKSFVTKSQVEVPTEKVHCQTIYTRHTDLAKDFSRITTYVLLTPNNSHNRSHVTDEGGTQSCTWQKAGQSPRRFHATAFQQSKDTARKRMHTSGCDGACPSSTASPFRLHPSPIRSLAQHPHSPISRGTHRTDILPMNGQGSSISWDLGSSWYSLSCLSVGDFLLGIFDLRCASAFPIHASTAAASPSHGYLSPRYLVKPGSPGRPPSRAC